MATTGVKSVRSEKNNSLSCESVMTPDLDRRVDFAREALLMRDFERCNKLCLRGISHAKQYPESSRAREGTEQLCLLCIQALAEMNKWQEVLPLIQNIYDGIEGCPHTVIKLCILLYAKVEEFSQCHAITSVWLRCKDNSSESGYAEVASLYIEHVMVHQGRLVLVPQFLDSCTVLDADVKQSLVETFNITSKDNTDTHKPADCRRNHQKETVNEDSNEDDQETDIYDVVLGQIKAWVSLIASKLSYPSVRILLKIAGIAVGLYLIFSISVKGDIMTSTGQAAVIWQGILRTWKSIFTPYRMGR